MNGRLEQLILDCQKLSGFYRKSLFTSGIGVLFNGTVGIINLINVWAFESMLRAVAALFQFCLCGVLCYLIHNARRAHRANWVLLSHLQALRSPLLSAARIEFHIDQCEAAIQHLTK